MVGKDSSRWRASTLGLKAELAAVTTRNQKCEEILAEHGIDSSSLAIIGADKPPDSDAWRVMVTGHLKPQYVSVEIAQRLAKELARIGERVLAERFPAAAATAKKQTLSGH